MQRRRREHCLIPTTTTTASNSQVSPNLLVEIIITTEDDYQAMTLLRLPLGCFFPSSYTISIVYATGSRQPIKTRALNTVTTPRSPVNYLQLLAPCKTCSTQRARIAAMWLTRWPAKSVMNTPGHPLCHLQ